jgi:spore coat protein U-like protein
MSSLNKFSKLVLLAALTAAAASSQAQTVTGSLPVSATVQATCVIGVVDAVSFGTYVQGVGAVDTTGTINLNCGSTVVYSVRLSGSSGATPRTMAQGANLLQYQLFRDAPRTQVWGETDGVNTVDGTGTGNSVALTVYGRLPDNGANQIAASGAYTSTVTITVAY